MSGLVSSSESGWEGRQAVRISPKASCLFRRKANLDNGFDDDGKQLKPLSVRITADFAPVDALLSRAGWRRQEVDPDGFLHHLLASTTETNQIL